MKHLLRSIIIITGFAACNSNPDMDTQSRNIQLLSDSTVYHNNTFSDTPTIAKTDESFIKTSVTPPVPVKRQKQINVAAKEKATKPVNITTAPLPPVDPVATSPVATPPVASSTGSTEKGNSTETGVDSSKEVTTAPIPPVEKKKGWSKAAQGAAIGGVGGAIGGAILSKKKGLGAVVGGVVGAAGGYIIGKGMDKKDNRLVIE